MNYNALITAIADAHQHAQRGAAGAVNRQLILRNWLIGAYLIEFEQHGKDRARYGVRLLKQVSSDLQQRSVAGCSAQMLERMRLFVRCYPQLGLAISSSAMRISPKLLRFSELQISASVMRKSGALAAKVPAPLPVECLLRLSWTHIIEMLPLSDPWKRAFYENECLGGNWSVRQLQRQIGSLLYERTGLSTDKRAVIARGRGQAAAAPLRTGDLMRDPYVLEFTGLAARPEHDESTLEKALLDHLQSFLLELGTGFCFEARQKRITVGNEHDYIDLVFFHRALRCHLLIDLKVRAFRHGDAGQMNFYLNYWKANMMLEGDNPPVGLLLCADKDQTKVEYATGGLPHELLVSRYLVVLPKPEELQALLEHKQAVRRQQSQPIRKKKTRKKS